MQETVHKWTLNPEQQDAFDYAVPWMLKQIPDAPRILLLEGYAGTGKTFVTNRMIEEVKRQSRGRISFGMTAPTHKAVKNLRKHSELKHQLDFGTIHSFLALKQVRDDRSGEVRYEPEWNPDRRRKIDEIDILILDEASMVDNKMTGYIEEELRNNDDLLVMFMGDPLQIPPVKQREMTGHLDALVFNTSYQLQHSIKVLTLTTPQRQAAESPIIMYAHCIRENPLSQKPLFQVLPEHKEHLELLDKNAHTMDAFVKEFFCTEEFEQDPDYCKVVAYRNETCKFFNNFIRLRVFNKDTLPKVVDGDKMVLNAPIIMGNSILMPNNTEFRVVRADILEKDYEYSRLNPNRPAIELRTEPAILQFRVKLKTYECSIETEDGVMRNISIIHEDSEQAYKTTVEKIVRSMEGYFVKQDRARIWNSKARFEEQFADASHNYCITAHKSQGSTYDYAVSMEWDMDVNRDFEERNRIKYVAATRCRHKLFIIK